MSHSKQQNWPFNSFFLIAGPCVIENEKNLFEIAEFLKKITDKLSFPWIFKASYDKANRSSLHSFRGPGLIKGLELLSRLKQELDILILSDVHSVEEINEASDCLDVLQIPAFLCRQTDLLVEAARTDCTINVKKGQFLSPWDMKYVVEKIVESGSQKILLTERGTSFGYNNLVSDMRSISIMKELGYPVVFDATHSVQLPGGSPVSSGQPQYAPSLAYSATVSGCDGLFFEVHPDPQKALSDGANMIKLSDFEDILKRILEYRKVHTSYEKVEHIL